MKIENIKKGGKYFHTICTQVRNKQTGKKFREVVTVRVVEVDQAKGMVCASTNGFPAVWTKDFTKWKTSNPRATAAPPTNN